MTSTSTVVRWAPVLAVAFILGACSSSDGATSEETPVGGPSEEIQEWMNRPFAGVSTEDSLGSASGVVVSTKELDDEQAAQQPVAVELGQGQVAVRGVLASCFGESTVDLTVHLSTTSDGAGTERTATTFRALPCGEDTELALEADGVTGVGFSVSGADRDGAWSAMVLGPSQG